MTTIDWSPTTIGVFLAAVGLLGMSKGGLTGMGMLSMPILLTVMPPAAAAGLLLPILMIQDAYSVWLYRGLWDIPSLKILLPAAAVGIALGLVLFWLLPTRPLLALRGVVTLAFAVRGLVRPSAAAKPPHPFVGRLLVPSCFAPADWRGVMLAYTLVS